LRDHQAEFDAKNAVVLGISFDTQEENKAFADKFDFKYPLLCDTSREVGVAYGAAEAGSTGFAKRIAIIIDPEGKVKHVDENVSPKGFAERTLALL
jgi:peroxiredoxin Q/BCP